MIIVDISSLDSNFSSRLIARFIPSSQNYSPIETYHRPRPVIELCPPSFFPKVRSRCHWLIVDFLLFFVLSANPFFTRLCPRILFLKKRGINWRWCIDGRFNELLRSSLSKHTGADSFGESVIESAASFPARNLVPRLPAKWFHYSLTRFFCVWTQMVWTKLLPLIPVLIHQPGLSLIEEDPVGKSFSAGLWIVPVRVLATNVR